jgi:hypothetical protein
VLHACYQFNVIAAQAAIHAGLRGGDAWPGYAGQVLGR